MDYRKAFIDVIKLEITQLEGVISNVGNQVDEVVNLILNSHGKVIISGIGKSGHIGKKIAATLASTGTPSFFVHPSEAYHGDLGMIQREDIVILISYSGETNEVLKLIPFLNQNQNKVVSLTGNDESTLAKNSDHFLSIQVEEEACAIGLAPTSSTTATLVIGDALAVTLMKARGFKESDFATFHPGGSLGRRLLTKVGDVMRKDNLPFITPNVDFKEIVMSITKGQLGLVIVGEPEKVLGIITDGDLRRAMLKYSDLNEIKVSEIMTKNPIVFDQSTRVSEVENHMKNKKISVVLIQHEDIIAGVYQIYQD